jgi:hypothetical protein
MPEPISRLNWTNPSTDEADQEKLRLHKDVSDYLAKKRGTYEQADREARRESEPDDDAEREPTDVSKWVVNE